MFGDISVNGKNNLFNHLKSKRIYQNLSTASPPVKISSSLTYSDFDEKKNEELKLLYLQLFREKKIYTNREKIQYLKLSKVSQRLHELNRIIVNNISSYKALPPNNVKNKDSTQFFDVENEKFRKKQLKIEELRENINLLEFYNNQSNLKKTETNDENLNKSKNIEKYETFNIKNVLNIKNNETNKTNFHQRYFEEEKKKKTKESKDEVEKEGKKVEESELGKIKNEELEKIKEEEEENEEKEKKSIKGEIETIENFEEIEEIIDEEEKMEKIEEKEKEKEEE
jgi:hypothetical protein